MKENILKISKFGLLIIAVLVICILLFKQCSGDKSGMKESSGNSSAIVNIENDSIDKLKKKNLASNRHVLESQTEESEVIELVEIDEDAVVSKAIGKSTFISPQIKKPNVIVIRKEPQTSMSRQFDDGVGEDQKPKLEDLLAGELKILEAKVAILQEKVRSLMERMRIFSEEKEKRDFVEEVNTVKNEDNLSDTSLTDMTEKEDDAYTYPIHVLSGGVSTYEKWTGYGFQACYTYRISKFVSLGGQGNAFLKDGKYSGDRDLYIGIRANFHVFPLFVENSRFDLYAAGTAGFGRDDSVDKFETMWYLGSSYDFNKYWGAFVEAGNIGVLGLRLRF
jgi:hypothetical protein